MDDKLRECKCGGQAKWRYARPVGWGECKNCGASTLLYHDTYEEADGKPAAFAAWKRYVRGETPSYETIGHIARCSGSARCG